MCIIFHLLNLIGVNGVKLHSHCVKRGNKLESLSIKKFTKRASLRIICYQCEYIPKAHLNCLSLPHCCQLKDSSSVCPGSLGSFNSGSIVSMYCFNAQGAKVSKDTVADVFPTKVGSRERVLNEIPSPTTFLQCRSKYKKWPQIIAISKND